MAGDGRRGVCELTRRRSRGNGYRWRQEEEEQKRWGESSQGERVFFGDWWQERPRDPHHVKENKTIRCNPVL